MALGATVMPHNVYLHSGIVQTRAYGETLPEKREALRFATLDSTVALMFALLINASILILAAATFHKTGRTDVAELGEAPRFSPHTSVSQSLRPDPQGGRSGERRRAGGLGCLNGMLDDLGRELMTRIGNRLHGAALPPMLPTRPPCRDNASGTSLLSRFDRTPQHGGAGHRSPAPSVRLAGRPRGGGRKQRHGHRWPDGTLGTFPPEPNVFGVAGRSLEPLTGRVNRMFNYQNPHPTGAPIRCSRATSFRLPIR